MNLLVEPTIEFCEKAGQGLIARPFYSLSDLAYLLAAFLILKKSRDLLARSFALTAFLIGFFSFVYDAHPIRLTQIFDLFGMYLFVGLLYWINLRRLSGKGSVNLIPLGIITFSLLATVFLAGLSGNIIFGLLILGYIISELYLRSLKPVINFGLWLSAFGIFLAGFAIWLLDYTKTFCTFGLLNGRAIFHYAGAAAVYLLYLYYSSQKEKVNLQ